MERGGRHAGSPVLVTGAQGFIGSWLVRRLLDDGLPVLAPARAELDVVDSAAVARVLEEHQVAAVFHLAGRSQAGAAERDPLGTFEANVRGTWGVLEACRTAAAPAARVVVTSSHRAGDGPYEVSKACADAISRSYAHAYGLPVGVLRLGNVYGGGDLDFTRLVPETARSLVRGEPPVLRSDGSQERDFLYVEDAVDAYLAVAASLDDPAARGRAWNCGAGEAVPVIDVVRRLIAAAGRKLEPGVQARGTPSGEHDRQTVDSSALRDELGWRPRWQLDSGLAETYRWYERELS